MDHVPGVGTVRALSLTGPRPLPIATAQQNKEARDRSQFGGREQQNCVARLQAGGSDWAE